MRFSELKKASLVGAFFVSIFLTFQAQALCPADGPLSREKVAKVIDGDTLRLADGRSVRLIGLNAPEMGRKGAVAEPFAQAARRRLQALVSDSGGYVRLQLGRQAKDHYGRLLAHAYDEQGDNLEARLLTEGLGFFVAIAPNTDLAECQLAAEQQARRASRALWRRSPVIQAGELRGGGFALISAHVERVQTNRGSSPHSLFVRRGIRRSVGRPAGQADRGQRVGDRPQRACGFGASALDAEADSPVDAGCPALTEFDVERGRLRGRLYAESRKRST